MRVLHLHFRYLTEEYDFAGTILILGAFALNSCVGSALLQPVKWHLKEEVEDKEEALKLNVSGKDNDVGLPNGEPFLTIGNRNSAPKIINNYRSHLQP